MRLGWKEFEGIYELELRRPLSRGWRDQESSVLTAVAQMFHMDVPWDRARVERLDLGGRPASMMVSRDRQGWTAVVVAPGEELALFGLEAPAGRDLRHVWRQWTAMLRTVRLYDPASAP